MALNVIANALQSHRKDWNGQRSHFGKVLNSFKMYKMSEELTDALLFFYNNDADFGV